MEPHAEMIALTLTDFPEHLLFYDFFYFKSGKKLNVDFGWKVKEYKKFYEVDMTLSLKVLLVLKTSDVRPVIRCNWAM